MKTRKLSRTSGLLLVTVLLASAALSGCGSKTPKSDSASPNTSTQAPKTDTKDLAPVNLTWYVVGTPQKDQQVVTDAINKILKEKINTTLTINTIDWGAYDQKMNVIVSSGSCTTLLSHRHGQTIILKTYPKEPCFRWMICFQNTVNIFWSKCQQNIGLPPR